MKKNIIIFDIDKTLVKGNLHEIIIGYWIQKRRSRQYIIALVNYFSWILPHPFLKRRVEYFVACLISNEELNKITSRLFRNGTIINCNLTKRITRYKRYDFEIALVTAAPTKIVKHLASTIGVKFYASRTILGILSYDLLAKKHRVYERLKLQGYCIRSIYSDSLQDFDSDANAYIITNNYNVSKII